MRYGPHEIGKLPPWNHQVEAFEFIKKRKRGLLAMDMGTGKSAVAVWVAAQHFRTLIVCPKAVIDVWPKQFELHSKVPVKVLPLRKGTVARKADILRRAIKKQETVPHHPPLVAVINHEAFWREKFWAALDDGARKWPVIVCDECHRMKSPGGKQSKKMKMLTQRHGEYVLGLTGTPMPHSPMDIYAQGRFIDPKVFGTSYTKFKARYAIMGGFEGRQVIGYQNEEQFAEKLGSMMYRVTADEVLDLPERTHEDRFFDLCATEKRTYKRLKTDLIAEVKGGTVTAANALVKVIRLAQVCCGHVTDVEGCTLNLGSSKEVALKDVFGDLDQKEPIVVFARFRADLDAIQRAAIDTGRRYRELSGRENELEAWQEGRGDVIGVQIQAGGAGVDLTRARICIYYSVGYSLGDYEQSLARVHRPGQTRPVSYIHLIARDTLEAKLYKALQDKRDVVEFVLEMIK